ncbi:MAG: tetratricopeptide repeat protein [Acidobacteriia bacterium]|nr:tetratricopeptide repeat protein [Terriglobia bacterium]
MGGNPRPWAEPDELRADDLLEGWKAIADHLRKTERTVQRWEKNKGLPVRRLRTDPAEEQGRVYAYKSELDAWWNRHTDLTLEPEVEPPAKADTGPRGTATEEASLPRPRTWALRFALVFALLLAAAGAYYFRPKVKLSPTLGVLPFDTSKGDADGSRIARGLTDELISRLGHLNPGSVSVIEDRSADYNLAGSVRTEGNRVAITARLVASKPQTHVVWGNSWEFERGDLIPKEIEIANGIVDEVLRALSLSSHASHPPAQDTYEAYLMGRALWSKRSAENLHDAIGFFQRAISTDPQFAPAYAGLADSYSLLGSAPYTGLPPKQAFPQAKAAAQKAIQLDDSLAEAHISLGYAELVYDRDYSEAEREFRRAMLLRPNSATAHQYYGYYLTAMGRLDDAIEERKTAQQLEPDSPLMDSALGEAYYQARQFDNTITYNKLSLVHDRSWPVGLINLGRAYEQKGMFAEALAAYQTILAVAPDDPGLLALAAHVHAVSGKPALARSTVAHLEQMRTKRYVPAVYIALVYVGLGDKDKAFEWLDRAYEEHCEYLVYLPTEPLADPLRHDPRFPRLIERLGLKVPTNLPR